MALGLSVTATSCTEETPRHLIPENTYVDLLVELQLLDSYVYYSQPDSLKVDSLRMVIFRHYGVTASQFRASHTYYQDHDLEAHRSRIGKAIEALRKDKVAARDSVASPPDSLH